MFYASHNSTWKDPNSKHLGTTVWDASMVFAKYLVWSLSKLKGLLFDIFINKEIGFAENPWLNFLASYISFARLYVNSNISGKKLQEGKV